MTYIPPGASCNVCKAMKAQLNHWYMIHLNAERITISAFNMNDVEHGIPCVCGEACLIKYVSKHLSAVVYPPSSDAEISQILADTINRASENESESE